MATQTVGTMEVSLDSFPPDEVKALGECYMALPKRYSSKPPGRFLRGKHGITHFHLQEPPSGGQRSRIAVLSHGIGTSMEVFEGPIVKELLQAGFRVLGYDFLAHGWSRADNKWLHYGKDVFLDQINELLDHVLAPGEAVDLWVGHSTGGIVGVLVAMSNKAHPIRDLALISPAFWANKPLIARIADKIPNFMHGLVSSIGPLKKLPQDAYLENNDIAFGVDHTGYLFPDEHSKSKQTIERLFTFHPQSIGGIMGVATYFLREDLITQFRETFKALAQSKEQMAPRVCLLWGKYDVVVPFERASEVMEWASSSNRFSLVELNAGHEAPAEIPTTVAQEIVKFSSAPARM